MEEPEADEHNFAPTQHRLPTVNAVDALQNAASNAKGISTNLQALDRQLLTQANGFSLAMPGLQRGHVTEVYGPPGVGKTAFGLQAVVNAILSAQDDSQVLWVNCGTPLFGSRLEQILQHYADQYGQDPALSEQSQMDVDKLLGEKFTYLDAHLLSRVLALFLHPPEGLPPKNTSLIVVDDLSNLLLSLNSKEPPKLKPDAPQAVQEKVEKQALSRRFRIIESLGAAMSKMAAVRNIAILVLSNATTTLKSSKKAILKPALSSQAWDPAIHTRIMLYRDFPKHEHIAAAGGDRHIRLRLAEIQRLGRKEVLMTPVSFVVEEGGLRELVLTHASEQSETSQQMNGMPAVITMTDVEDAGMLPEDLTSPSPMVSATESRKRRLTEVADSEDEEDVDDGADEVGKEVQVQEPELPKILTASQWREEMILETHESALLRADRYACLRGSEDDVPLPSSSDAEQADVE
jgi:RecA/RadA recombinase